MKRNKLTLMTIGVLLITAFACKKDTKESVVHAIGDTLQGGKIAYILKQGDPGYVAGTQHGIIAAPMDQSTGIQWYNGTNSVTGAIDTALGTGKANTATIISKQGAGSYAAKLCDDLVLGGYSDWYLPSKDELNVVYINQAAIGGFATDAGYWTSSESDQYFAWSQNLTNSGQGTNLKTVTYHVRAIHTF